MKKAFTLIEVIAVLTIISIILAIAALGYQEVHKRAVEQQIQVDQEVIKLAAKQAIVDGITHPKIEELVQKGYLTTMISPPRKSSRYVIVCDEKDVRVFLQGENNDKE